MEILCFGRVKFQREKAADARLYTLLHLLNKDGEVVPLEEAKTGFFTEEHILAMAEPDRVGVQILPVTVPLEEMKCW